MISERAAILYYERIDRAIKRGDFDAANAELDELFREGDEAAKAWGCEYRGRIAETQGDLPSARKHYLDGLKHCEGGAFSSRFFLNRMAQNYERAGDSDEALVWHRRALQNGDSSPFTLDAFLRLNNGEIPDADRSLVIPAIERSWETFKTPGEPDLDDLPKSIEALNGRLNDICDAAMIPPDIGEVIAQRKLVFTDVEGNRCDALVEIGRPRLSDEREGLDMQEGYYVCVYRITGLDYERVSRGMGVDSIDALRIAMNFIGADLAYVRRNSDGEIRWEAGEDGDLGFPVPSF